MINQNDFENYRRLKQELISVIQKNLEKDLNGIKPPQSELHREYESVYQSLCQDKGKNPYFPFIGTGRGWGPYVECADGSVKLDLITGIGVNFFGHAHPLLQDEMIDSILCDVMQGNLLPGVDQQAVIHELLKHVGAQSRLKHGWLFCSGTMANENALKIIRQKKSPASKVFAFEDCFAGRSMAMAEVTDNAAYRDGLPTYGEVVHVPFYQAKEGVDKSVQAILKIIRSEMTRYPGQFAALTMELVQGEGGFNVAPKEFYKKLFTEIKKLGLYIWIDEIQTFGRTEQLFAYQMLECEEFVDVVTIGKLSQVCAMLFTEELSPRPGLVAGTFVGSAGALRTGKKIIEHLTTQNFYGPQGKNAQLGQRFVEKLTQLNEELSRETGKKVIGEIRQIGGMIAFQPFEGTMEQVKVFLQKLYHEGVIAFYCGHGPYLVRLLPPLAILKEEHIEIAIQKFKTVFLACIQAQSQETKKAGSP